MLAAGIKPVSTSRHVYHQLDGEQVEILPAGISSVRWPEAEILPADTPSIR